MMRFYGVVGTPYCETDETDKGPDEGWLEMKYQRPDSTDYTAQEDGTWAITLETINGKLIPIEDEWREAEMGRIAEQLLMLEDDDPGAQPGTAAQWRAYRIELRKWTTDNPDFPDMNKRPIQPS